MAATCRVSLCLLLVSVTFAQNSISLEDRFEMLEREFATEKAKMNSEIESTRNALDMTRSQLQETQSQLWETRKQLAVTYPGGLHNPGTTNFQNEHGHKSENVLGWNNTTKSRALSQIMEKWIQNATRAQGGRIPSIPVPGTNRRNRRQAINFNAIAFHAELGIPVDSLKVQQAIVFDTTTLNTNMAYSENNGVFTCQETGTYFFTVSIMVFPQEKVETEMVVNGNQMLLTFAAGTTAFGQGTSSTAVHLQQGDRVWVRILNVPTLSTGTNIRVMGGGWSSFTGFLIQ
ncbi:complement C1q tumor necrosis factor-related protein 5-like [Ylistrum balloti]|uniref:complement C1q tumor necrosis factor-related protein 5-like n=1 Tax=Ylistrum balloti TaxID=509963 RepID=UPI002905F288|nr:complement C1q tumor necrosis factor-related protein 5-like [Ylistrum balloti]